MRSKEVLRGKVYIRLLILRTVPTFNYCTKCVGSPGIMHDRTPHTTQFPRHGCMDDLTTERSFDSLVTLVIDVRSLFYDVLSMDLGTTRHRQTSGRLVQKLNVCTVVVFSLKTYNKTRQNAFWVGVVQAITNLS